MTARTSRPYAPGGGGVRLPLTPCWEKWRGCASFQLVRAHWNRDSVRLLVRESEGRLLIAREDYAGFGITSHFRPYPQRLSFADFTEGGCLSTVGQWSMECPRERKGLAGRAALESRYGAETAYRMQRMADTEVASGARWVTIHAADVIPWLDLVTVSPDPEPTWTDRFHDDARRIAERIASRS